MVKVKLSSITNIIMGQSPPGETYNERGDGLPFYQGIADFSTRFPSRRVYCTKPTRIANENDILLSVRAPIGRINITNEVCAIGRGLSIIRVKEKNDFRFIEYCLKSLRSKWDSFEGSGSVFGNARREDLEQLEIPWINNPDERSLIGQFLGSLDDKIELNRRMNTTLEAMAKVLFRQWFVESEEAKDWEVGKLGDIAENIRRGAQPNEIEPTTPYIGLEHMPRQSIALSEWGTASEVTSNKFWFKQGEFLFGKLRPYFHKVGIAPLDGVGSTDILVITPKSPEWYGLVLSHISSTELVKHTDVSSTGTKMPRTSWQDIERYQISIPPKDLAKSFTDIILPMVRQIQANIMQSRTLASLRDGLLPRLMNGEVRVKDVL